MTSIGQAQRGHGGEDERGGQRLIGFVVGDEGVTAARAEDASSGETARVHGSGSDPDFRGDAFDGERKDRSEEIAVGGRHKQAGQSGSTLPPERRSRRSWPGSSRRC